MKRVLYKPAQYVDVDGKKIRIRKNQTLFVDDLSKDHMTQYGVIKKAELKKTKGTVTTTKGKIYNIFLPSYADQLFKIKRKAQIITPKDAANIFAKTGITKKTVVVEAGTGSAGLSCFLAPHAKHIYSYDVDDEVIALAKENVKKLGIKNVTINKHDIAKPIKQKADVFILDMLDPEKAIPTVIASLKPGGYVVAYTPSITQALSFVNAALAHDCFAFIETVESIQRNWNVTGKICRPKTEGFGHSAFLTYFRKIN